MQIVKKQAQLPSNLCQALERDVEKNLPGKPVQLMVQRFIKELNAHYGLCTPIAERNGIGDLALPITLITVATLDLVANTVANAPEDYIDKLTDLEHILQECIRHGFDAGQDVAFQAFDDLTPA